MTQFLYWRWVQHPYRIMYKSRKKMSAKKEGGAFNKI